MLSVLLMLDHSLTNLAESINLQLGSANIKIKFEQSLNSKSHVSELGNVIFMVMMSHIKQNLP